MKKNSDTRNGRYESPLRPSEGRRIWSRTARIAISPRFCTPRGTSLGLRNAAQKNTITTSAARIPRSIGLVNPNEPMVKNGFHSKSCRPGAGNPHPLKMWQPPLASTPTSPVTGHLPFSPGGTTPPVTPPILGGSRSPQTPSAIPGGSRSPQTPSAVAVNDEAERDGQAHQHADGEQQRYVDGPADQPADGAVGRHPREQVAEHRPADVQALGPALRRGPLLGLRAGVVAAAHLTRLAAPLSARARHTAS